MEPDQPSTPTHNILFICIFINYIYVYILQLISEPGTHASFCVCMCGSDALRLSNSEAATAEMALGGCPDRCDSVRAHTRSVPSCERACGRKHRYA